MGGGYSIEISGFGWTQKTAIESLDAKLFYEHGARVHVTKDTKKAVVIYQNRSYDVRLSYVADDDEPRLMAFKAFTILK